MPRALGRLQTHAQLNALLMDAALRNTRADATSAQASTSLRDLLTARRNSLQSSGVVLPNWRQRIEARFVADSKPSRAVQSCASSALTTVAANWSGSTDSARMARSGRCHRPGSPDAATARTSRRAWRCLRTRSVCPRSSSTRPPPASKFPMSRRSARLRRSTPRTAPASAFWSSIPICARCSPASAPAFRATTRSISSTTRATICCTPMRRASSASISASAIAFRTTSRASPICSPSRMANRASSRTAPAPASGSGGAGSSWPAAPGSRWSKCGPMRR